MDVRKITLVGIGMALNVVGAFIALQLRLPIYLDSVGTILVAYLLGPKYAIVAGLGGSFVSGMTFDIYSLYFAPVQITTGYFAGIMYQKQMLKGKKTLVGVLVVSLPTAFISAVVAGGIFGGITSSGSSYIVQVLSALGASEVMSVFIVQLFTDYMDEYIAVLLVTAGVGILPGYFKNAYRRHS